MMSDIAIRSTGRCSKFIGSLGLIGRGLAAPPGTPEGAITVMQTAWEKMMKDPEFVADARKRKLRVIPTDAATIQKVVNEAISKRSPEVVRWRVQACLRRCAEALNFA